MIDGANRGIAFMVAQGGYVANVVLSNLVINSHRYDWFWWGDGDPIHFMIERGNEKLGQVADPNKPGDQPAGSIHDVIIRNVIAHGRDRASSPAIPKLAVQHQPGKRPALYLHDPSALYDKSVDAMQFQYVKNLTVKDVTVNWEKPEWKMWKRSRLQGCQRIEPGELRGRTGAASNGHSCRYPGQC